MEKLRVFLDGCEYSYQELQELFDTSVITCQDETVCQTADAQELADADFAVFILTEQFLSKPVKLLELGMLIESNPDKAVVCTGVEDAIFVKLTEAGAHAFSSIEEIAFFLNRKARVQATPES